MGILTAVTQVLPGRQRTVLAEIRDLPDGQRLGRLGRMFYEACFEQAVRFVKDHIGRPDSPFMGLPRDRFFHEIMALNFWVVERLLETDGAALKERIYRLYEDSFAVPQGRTGGASGGFAERHAVYSASWNDITGHQDVFALRVAERIFGDGASFPAPQASFWIISYTHEVMDDLAALQARCRAMRVPLS